MKVYKDLSALPKFEKAVITTGSFDGVHSGHLQIIEQLKKEAAKIGGTPVLITFYPHPKQVIIMKEKALHILNTPAEKYNLLAENGIENIVVVNFDDAFSNLTAEQYVADFLVKYFSPAAIVVGYDHRFGKNREGNFDLLKSLETKHNFEIKEIPELVLTNITISSTKIREAMLAGEIEKAALFLKYDYFFSGLVVLGKQLGRTIGYPTANLEIEDIHKLIPANGVYAVDVKLGSRRLKGMMNIGFRPTVDGKMRTIEVNIFDFDEDIYGEELTVTLKNNLRLEQKFDGLDALKVQLKKDEIRAREVNG